MERFPRITSTVLMMLQVTVGDFIVIVNVPLLGAIPSAPRIVVQF
jgi:hypothetical protein